MSIVPINQAAQQFIGSIPDFSVKSITEDVFVKGLHSHNDYWRDMPLISSLLKGVQSVEADIWAFDESFSQNKFVAPATVPETTTNTSLVQEFGPETIYVGHDLNYLNQSWTLSNLYLDPLFSLLENANPRYNNPKVSGDLEPHGVWYGAAASTLYLFLDTKLDANTTYTLVKPLLRKFIDNDYLTYYNESASEWVMGPLTIVLTGNLPEEMVKAEETRYVSLDGKLDFFNQTSTTESLQDIARYSVIASASFAKLFGGSENMKHNDFNETEKSILNTTINKAHEFGLKTRIWEHTNWPIYLRDSQNEDLVAMGTDLLNIDDLNIADKF